MSALTEQTDTTAVSRCDSAACTSGRYDGVLGAVGEKVGPEPGRGAPRGPGSGGDTYGRTALSARSGRVRKLARSCTHRSAPRNAG